MAKGGILVQSGERVIGYIPHGKGGIFPTPAGTFHVEAGSLDGGDIVSGLDTASHKHRSDFVSPGNELCVGKPPKQVYFSFADRRPPNPILQSVLDRLFPQKVKDNTLPAQSPPLDVDLY